MQDQKWRGRIADCNGSIEQVGARAERYHSIENVAAVSAIMSFINTVCL